MCTSCYRCFAEPMSLTNNSGDDVDTQRAMSIQSVTSWSYGAATMESSSVSRCIFLFGSINRWWHWCWLGRRCTVYPASLLALHTAADAWGGGVGAGRSYPPRRRVVLAGGLQLMGVGIGFVLVTLARHRIYGKRMPRNREYVVAAEAPGVDAGLGYPEEAEAEALLPKEESYQL